MRVTVHLHKDDTLAVLVSKDGIEAHAFWLPKSQIKSETLGLGARLSIDAPDWLWKSKGLVPDADTNQLPLMY